MNKRKLILLLLAVAAAMEAGDRAGWWMEEPVRLIQTNLRETDSTLDARRLAEQLAAFPANAILFNMGGIVAHYPTKVPYHYASTHLAPGRDLFGDMVKEAHARGIRVIGRFDLSKTQKAVYEAHPEWFFRRANGEPAIYNGLYATCINGGYYHEHAKAILGEALERYEVDALFFNMFGNPGEDYSGNPLGPCHCESCRKLYRARHQKEIPAAWDEEHRQFMEESTLKTAEMIAGLIHGKRPGTGFFTYLQQHTDGIMSESNTSVRRPLPLWPYSASDNVNRACNSERSKMAFNLCISFVDFPWRFAMVPRAEIRSRLYQSMAHGAGPALNMHGPLDQEDRSAVEAAREVFRWHKRHEDLYRGQESAARVLVVGSRRNSYRGLFRILTERHVPFAVADNLKWLEDGRRFDLVVAPDGVPETLEGYVRGGGRLLVCGPAAPPFGVSGVVTRRPHTQGYWRVRDHSLLPSLESTNVLMLDGEYSELPAVPKPVLTLIPPAMFGPPEKVWVNKVETDTPGLLVTDFGAGRMAWIPWDVGGLYYRHSLEAHAGLVADLVDHLLVEGRQLLTNAHPLVEITVMRQPGRNRTLAHFVNLSGHSQTAYFEPLEMRDIRVSVKGAYRAARSATLGVSLPLTVEGAYATFTLPALGGYDAVVLE